MKNWFIEFNRGRRSINDEVREGRPNTEVVSENIATERDTVPQKTFIV